MSRRRTTRLMLGMSACVIALVPACADVQDDAAAPPGPGQAPDAQGVFEVAQPIDVVAGDRQAWLLKEERDGSSLSRVGVTGPPVDVRRVPGQGPQMVPYRDGVVVASVACADSSCAESITSILVVDGRGTTVSTQEFARQPGSPESSDAVQLIGVQGDVVWIRTAAEVIAYNPQAGQTVTRAPAPNGVSCLLVDGVHSLLSLNKQLGQQGVATEATMNDPYEVAVHRLVDGNWALLPETRRTLTELQFGTTECVAGAVRTGPADSASPAWSPTTGWVEGEPVRGRRTGPPPSAGRPGAAPAVAAGQGDQRFVLQGDGELRRVFSGRGAPMKGETVRVPAGVFKADRNGPPSGLLFDKSATVQAGCALQPEGPTTAKCYIGTP